ncbi:MAG: ATP-binding protein [Acidaminococcus sp.]|nr:ATP-binding protein [Acidaminococcus sp.]MCI2100878.1 ATP-binding protein [Acidaminococcus sp.]MCI2115234.1 ATP-binding protein [Acidaminococcus sp.]MCI2117283.1 ATP-binding protein [Acidaminococcus sp.]
MEREYTVAKDDFERAGAASISLKELLQKLGLSPELIRRIAIGTYEGEINCLIHGGGGTVKAEIDGKAIKIIISDHGPGIPDVGKAMQEGWSTASEEIRAKGFGAGMGLPNMKKVSDDMVINTTPGEGTTVTMTFNC